MASTLINPLKNATQVQDLVNQSIKWVEQGINVDHKDATLITLKQHRRELKRVVPNIDSKPTLGLFGASQAGKSNLAKNLLREAESGICYVYDAKNNRKFDYNRYANPDGGGQEATAVLTRFRKYDQADTAGVTIELFSVAELICCFTTGYFTVVESFEDGGPISILIDKATKTLDSIDTSIISEAITEDDVYSIKEYLEAHLGVNASLLLTELNKQDFWRIVASTVRHLNVDRLVSLFSVFWNGHKSISEFFKSLVTQIKQLDFAETISAEASTIFKQIPEGYDEGISCANILDVNTLYRFGDGTIPSYRVSTSKDDYQIGADKLCAISKEVVLTVKLDNDVIGNYDILDFPGAREATGVDVDNLQVVDVAQLLLRGKVKYLFNAYSQQYKINNLVVTSCMTMQKDGASLIPSLLKGWVSKYIGKDAVSREQTLLKADIPPLFLVLTFWNNVLVKQDRADLDSPKEKLESAFTTRFRQDIYANYDWHEKWSNGKSFKNIFLLRDFEYCTLYGPKSQIIEDVDAALDDDKQRYFDIARSFFSTQKMISTRFANPLKSFNEASLPGKDGSGYFIDQLLKVDAMAVKSAKYASIIRESYTKTRNLMESFVRGDDKGAMITDAKRKSMSISSLLSMMPDSGPSSFSNFLERYTMTTREVYERVHSMLQTRDLIEDFGDYDRLIGSMQLRAGMTATDVETHLLALYDLPDNDALQSHLGEMGISLDKVIARLNETMQSKSELLVNKVFDYWTVEKIDQISASDFPSARLTDAVITQINNALKHAFTRMGMIQFIAEKVTTFVDVIAVNPSSYELVANIVAGHFNKFATSAGWDYLSSEERAAITDMARSNGIVFYDSSIEKDGVSVDVDLAVASAIDYIDKKHEIGVTVESVKKHPGLSHMYRWQDQIKMCKLGNIGIIDYDPEANTQLVNMLEASGRAIVNNN